MTFLRTTMASPPSATVKYVSPLAYDFPSADGLIGLGKNVEAILSGVLGFVMGGIVLFGTCFVVTHVYIAYKKRIFDRKRDRDGRMEECYDNEEIDESTGTTREVEYTQQLVNVSLSSGVAANGLTVL